MATNKQHPTLSAGIVEKTMSVLLEQQTHYRALRQEYKDIADRTTSHRTYQVYMFKYQQIDNLLAKTEREISEVSEFLPLPS